VAGTYVAIRFTVEKKWVRADIGGGYVRGYTVYRGEKVLFQDRQSEFGQSGQSRHVHPT
jgi:hypothetical protein